LIHFKFDRRDRLKLDGRD